MALAIDTTRPLRTQGELSDLVAAIVAASPAGESDWLEWKSTLDLRSKVTQGVIARTIIGMANRPVGAALHSMGGLGYIVIGAEPGSVTGVTEIDPAELGRGIQDYLGEPGGPAWRFAYIAADSRPVLVVTVEPPRPGDRIRALHKETERPKNVRGTVLVRRPGQTAQADPGEIRALEDRFAMPLLDALNDRSRERLEKISEAVDAVFDVVKDAQPSDRPPVRWTVQRNRLEDLLAGWDGPDLPSVVMFAQAGTAYQALMYYSAARTDVRQQLWRLDQQKQDGRLAMVSAAGKEPDRGQT